MQYLQNGIILERLVVVSSSSPIDTMPCAIPTVTNPADTDSSSIGKKLYAWYFMHNTNMCTIVPLISADQDIWFVNISWFEMLIY